MQKMKISFQDNKLSSIKGVNSFLYQNGKGAAWSSGLDYQFSWPHAFKYRRYGFKSCAIILLLS